MFDKERLRSFHKDLIKLKDKLNFICDNILSNVNVNIQNNTKEYCGEFEEPYDMLGIITMINSEAYSIRITGYYNYDSFLREYTNRHVFEVPINWLFKYYEELLENADNYIKEYEENILKSYGRI